MRTITVRLNESEVTIAQLKTRQAAAWRREVLATLNVLVEPLITVLDWREVDHSDPGSIKKLLDALEPVLLDAMDAVTDALIKYAPHLKETIENAYDDEIIAAFVEVLKLSLPFSTLARILAASGSQTPETSPNSVSASGGDGTTS